jgi:hypothetical protein
MKWLNQSAQKKALAAITCLIISASSCASWQIRGVRSLEQRTLDIAPDFAGFVYYQEECKSEFLGICMKHEIVKYTYDLNDEKVRQQLIDMGFAASVRESVK